MLSISSSSGRRPVQWILFEQWMLFTLTLVRLWTQSPVTSVGKLTRYGLGKEAVGSMAKWWSCESQRVMVSGAKSSRRNVTSNVPHRFILEPIQSRPSVITWVTKISMLTGSLHALQNWGVCLIHQMVLVCAIQQKCAALQQDLDREESN